MILIRSCRIGISSVELRLCKFEGAPSAHKLHHFALLVCHHHLIQVCVQVFDKTVDLGLHGVPLHVSFALSPFQKAAKIRHDIVLGPPLRSLLLTSASLRLP